MTKTRSKLELEGERVMIGAASTIKLISAIFRKAGCADETAHIVAEHLVDTSLCGIESHGVMRTLQYVDQFENGTMDPKGVPRFGKTERGSYEVDGGRGIGIPAMQLAYDKVIELARDSGLAALAIRNVGHTGRHGAFADRAAEAGYLTIMMGGGNRQTWRQVAPHGGTKALLPTNPYCIGIPGGERGPVVLDFATSKIAGGWIYAARSAGAKLPANAIIDKKGQPTQDPEDYFDGGAILPAGGQKGYALALVAELIGDALLGPEVCECNWLLIALDCNRFRAPNALQSTAEAVLAEMRSCPPAPGFERVEVPGEREREQRRATKGQIALPQRTWEQILALANRLGCES